MTKLTLADVSNLLGSPTSAANTINANSDAIITALENTLSRDGTSPNQMLADLDMNHNDILNTRTVYTDELILDGQTFTGDTSEWTVGTGIPSPTLGNVKDMYLNSANGDVYGPKTDAGWGSVVANIRGPAGPSGSGVTTVTTISALKAVDTTTSTAVILTAPRIGGLFIWNSGDYSSKITADTQNGVYVKANAVASNLGSWVRVYSGPLNVRWFGAVGDGVTADNIAIQAAVNLCGVLGGGVVYIPEGTFKTGSVITVSNPYVWIRGAGILATTIAPSTSGQDAFKFDTGTSTEIKNSTVTDLAVLGSASVNRAFWIRNHYHFLSERVAVWGTNAIGYEFENGTVAYNGILRDVFVNGSTNSGVLLGANGTGDLQNIIIYNGHFDGGGVGNGVTARNCGGLVWQGGESLNKSAALLMAPNVSGYRVNGIRCTGIFFDTPQNAALIINATTGTRVSDSIFVNCHFNNSQNDSGVIIAGPSTDPTLVDTIKFVACNFIINKKFGIYATYCQKLTITACDFLSNGVDGTSSNIALDVGVSYVNIIGGTSGSGSGFGTLSRWGVAISSGVTNIVIDGINLVGNALGPVSDNGTGTIIKNCPGVVTYAKGSSSVASGSNAVTINHGLSFTPNKEDCVINPISDTQGPRYWVSSTSSTQFIVSLSANAPAQWFFGWQVGVKGN